MTEESVLVFRWLDFLRDVLPALEVIFIGTVCISLSVSMYLTIRFLAKPDPRTESNPVIGHAEHLHADATGNWHRCFHSCKGLFTDWKFWAGMTLGFPLEHWLWVKVWPFSLFTQWVGL